MRKLSFFFFVWLAWVTAAGAQTSPNFTVEVSSDSVLLGNHIAVRFTLDQGEGADFQPPAFGDFDVISGPNVSTSFSSINGKVSQQISYTFYLRPHDVGNFFIEPASIRSGSQVLETTPLEVIVLPNPDGIRQESKSFKNDMLPFQWLNLDDMPALEDMLPPGAAPSPAPETPKPQKKKKTYKL